MRINQVQVQSLFRNYQLKLCWCFCSWFCFFLLAKKEQILKLYY